MKRNRAFVSSQVSSWIGNTPFTRPRLIPALSGGGAVTSDATYYYRTFNSTDTLTVSTASINCDVLIVAGGGGDRYFNCFYCINKL